MNRVEIKKRQVYAIAVALFLVNLYLIYRMIGFNGMAYFIVPFCIYMFAQTLINSNSVNTLGRLIRLRISKEQYRNAENMGRNVLVFQTIISAVFVVLFILLAGVITEKLFSLNMSTGILMVLIPSLLFKTMTTGLLGKAKGFGSQASAMLTDILRQIFFAILLMLFGKLLQEYGVKVSALLVNENYAAMYGGLGVALGYTVTEFVVFLVAVVLSFNNRKTFPAETMRTAYSFGDNVKAFIMNKIPGTLVVLLLVFSAFPGMLLLQKRSENPVASADTIGIYTAVVAVVIGILSAIIFASVLPACGKVLGSLRKNEQRYCRNYFHAGFHLISVRGIFFVMFLMVGAHRIGSIVYPAQSVLAEQLLQRSSICILGIVFAFYFAELLIFSGKQTTVLLWLFIGDVVLFIVNLLFFNLVEQPIFAIAYSLAAYCLLMAVLMGTSIFKKLRISPDIVQYIVIPAVMAAVSGLIMLFLDKLFTPHLGEALTLFICYVVSGSIYWFGLMVLRNFTSQELENMPGTGLIKAVGQMLHAL